MQGAAILTATVAIVKVIGAIYKIPLGNILTDEGYGYFNVAYSIYSLLLTLSTAGLPIALSRMIATANAEGRPMQVRRTFSVARMAFFVLGLLGTLAMLLFPEQLATAMNSSAAAPSIAALAPAVVLVCLMSAYRGYTQGLSDMVPTSVSQIIEVLSKLVFGLFLAWWALKQGYGLPIASAGAIVGVSAGSLLALIYVIVYKRRMEKSAPAPGALRDVPLSSGQTLKRLVAIGIPVTLGSSILSILGLIDTKLILNRLQFSVGLTEPQANTLFGVYSKVQTLFNLPSAFIVPLTISIIPAISAFVATGAHDSAAKVSATSLKLTTLLALPAGVGLSVLAEPIMKVLYPGSHAEGPVLLMILGVASFFVCLTLITNAILQAYGHERFPMYTMPIGGVVKIILTWGLVGMESIGVRGAAIGSFACYFIISVINLFYIRYKLPGKLNILKLTIRPLLSTCAMGAAAWLSYSGLLRVAEAAGLDTGSRLGLLLCMCGAILVAVVVYLIMIIVTRAISAEDLEHIPKGGKIARILHIK